MQGYGTLSGNDQGFGANKSREPQGHVSDWAAAKDNPLLSGKEGTGVTLSSLGYGEGRSARDGLGLAPIIDPDSPHIPKSVFVRVIEARRHRAAQCRSVPVSVALYIFYIICMLTHVNVELGFDFEKSLVDNVVAAGGGFALASSADWYTWMKGSLIAYVLADTDPSLGIPAIDRGYFEQYALMLGGIRMVQTRSQLQACNGLSGPLQTAYGNECYPYNALSSAPFGNATLAEAYGVLSAFQPVSPQLQDGSVDGGAEFEFYLDVEADMDVNQGIIDALAATNWLDAATRDVRVQIALLNGETAAYGRVEFYAAFTRGTRINLQTSTISIPTDPYTGSAYLYAMDAVIILYWIYLSVGTIRRLVQGLRTPGATFGERFASLFTYYRLLDVGNSISLLVVIITWAETCNKLAGIRSYIASVNATPVTFSTGPSDIQNKIYEATQMYGSFKIAAVMTLIFLTLRLFKYFKFQPRLAVMTEVFSRGLSDAVHFGFLFGLVLCMYGVWAHFMFGTQAPDWVDITTSIVSVFRCVMYDYDMVVMETQYRAMADFFYCTFMILVTNLVLWMFLAILLENYTEIRYESHKGPSAWEEAVAYVATLPQTISPWCKRRHLDASGGLVTLHDLTWKEILLAVKEHPELRFCDIITAGPLSAGLHITEDDAERLINEVHTSALITGATLSKDEHMPAAALYGGLPSSRFIQVATSSSPTTSARPRALSVAPHMRALSRATSIPTGLLSPAMRKLSRAQSVRMVEAAASALAANETETADTIHELKDMVAALSAQIRNLSHRMGAPTTATPTSDAVEPQVHAHPSGRTFGGTSDRDDTDA